jgi:hypothetical protein
MCQAHKKNITGMAVQVNQNGALIDTLIRLVQLYNNAQQIILMTKVNSVKLTGAQKSIGDFLGSPSKNFPAFIVHALQDILNYQKN